MRRTRTCILTLSLLGATCLPVSPADARHPGFPFGAPTGIPQAFRITPSKPAYFMIFGLFYNPKSKLYVVFYKAESDRDYIYSLLYDARGRAKSSPLKVLASDPFTIWSHGFAYNAREDAFLMVWTDSSNDAIRGLLLDGRGRVPGGTPKPFVVKPASGQYSALGPAAFWLPATNQYAVTWAFCDTANSANPRNGQYLSLLDRTGRPLSKPKFVKRQAMENDMHIGSVVVLPDKLVWGSSVDGPGSTVKPAVWMTDFTGRIVTSVGAGGMLYPDGALPDQTHVFPVYDPDHGRVLLHWSWVDREPAGHQENRFRIMDTQGLFITGPQAVPKKDTFQLEGEAVYNPVDKRFFWACPEYKVLFQEDPYLDHYRGKIWGFYLDADGNFENKQGEDKFSAIPLTPVFPDTAQEMHLEQLAVSSRDGSVLAAYRLANHHSVTSECWGFIYK